MPKPPQASSRPLASTTSDSNTSVSRSFTTRPQCGGRACSGVSSHERGPREPERRRGSLYRRAIRNRPRRTTATSAASSSIRAPGLITARRRRYDVHTRRPDAGPAHIADQMRRCAKASPGYPSMQASACGSCHVRTRSRSCRNQKTVRYGSVTAGANQPAGATVSRGETFAVAEPGRSNRTSGPQRER